MICTVTFNPSLDYIVSVDDFQLGMTNRTSSELILPGGKGINVSIVLKNLGLDSTALGYAAGFTGEELIRRLNEFGVNADFIKIDHGMTRINLKLKSIDGTETFGCGSFIAEIGAAFTAPIFFFKKETKIVLRHRKEENSELFPFRSKSCESWRRPFCDSSCRLCILFPTLQ